MPVLEIEGLTKSYRSPDGEVHAVLDVPHFALAEHGEVALRGRSGSGKTTFLNVVAGILKPDSGKVVVDGRDIVRLSEAERDAHRAVTLGYVFQTFNLLEGYTALENVMLAMMFGGPGVDRGFAAQLLAELGLSDRMFYRPSQLSVGQQQRVAVARALANRPKLVLADEPTGSLDPERADEALELVRRLCRQHGAALLLVSHDRAVLERFESMVDLSDINHAAGRRE